MEAKNRYSKCEDGKCIYILTHNHDEEDTDGLIELLEEAIKVLKDFKKLT